MRAESRDERSDYVAAAMRRASFTRMTSDGTFFGEVPGLSGVWANAPTRDACQEELESVLKGWIQVREQRGLALPPIPEQIRAPPNLTVPRLVPLSRRELVSRLRTLGFDGPFPGGGHEYMVRDDLVVGVPNPHTGDISIDLLRRILRNAGISRDQWLSSG